MAGGNTYRTVGRPAHEDAYQAAVHGHAIQDHRVQPVADHAVQPSHFGLAQAHQPQLQELFIGGRLQNL